MVDNELQELFLSKLAQRTRLELIEDIYDSLNIATIEKEKEKK